MSGRWDDLATEVRKRRAELGISQQELAERAGLSHVTLRNAEQGFVVRRQTLSKLDAGLAWPPGTAESVISGDASSRATSDMVRDLYARLSDDGMGPSTYRLGSELLAYLARDAEASE